jgi:hypothetical protein
LRENALPDFIIEAQLSKNHFFNGRNVSSPNSRKQPSQISLFAVASLYVDIYDYISFPYLLLLISISCRKRVEIFECLSSFVPYLFWIKII